MKAVILSVALGASPSVRVAPAGTQTLPPGVSLPATAIPQTPGLMPTTGVPLLSAAQPGAPGPTGPQPPAGDWRRGTFVSEDGIPLAYHYRPGAGPAILIVHGRGLGAQGFAAWRELFPGRAVILLERRGYGSEAGFAHPCACNRFRRGLRA